MTAVAGGNPFPLDARLMEVELERGLAVSGLGAADLAADGAAAVTVVDVSGPEEEVARALWEAASTLGFFIVVGHGFPQELTDRAFEISRQFFAQRREDKEGQSPHSSELNSGFEFKTQVRPSTGLPDNKESMQVTASSVAMQDRWPTEPKDFEPTAREFISSAHALASRLLNLLQRHARPDLDPGHISAAHTLWGAQGQCTLRMLHYPPVTADDVAKLGPGTWRAGAHTDWDCLTLLFQRPGEAGLECAANPRSDRPGAGRWIPVEYVEGGIAINVGDMLSRVRKFLGERDTERVTEKDRDRQTDRDRQRERQTQTQTQRDRERHKERERERKGETERDTQRER